MKDSSAPQFTGLVSIGLEVHFLPLLPRSVPPPGMVPSPGW